MQRTIGACRRLAAAASLVVLATCGGGSGGAVPAMAGSKLFVSDGGQHAIGSMKDPNPGPGTFLLDRVITGSNTGLGSGGTPSPSTIPSMAIDAAKDSLYVATQTRVIVFDQASQANGNVAPSRSIVATVTKNGVLSQVNFYGLFLDTTNDRLYVAEPDGHVHVFDGASAVSGSVTPNRTIFPDFGPDTPVAPTGIAVDSGNRLYVGSSTSGPTGGSRIFRFDNASTLSTPSGSTTAANQTLTFAQGVEWFHLDGVNDRLYVAQFNGPIHVFNGASTLTSTATPNRTITLPPPGKFLFVDAANDRLYAAANNALFIINSAATASDPSVTATMLSIASADARFSAVAVKP